MPPDGEQHVSSDDVLFAVIYPALRRFAAVVRPVEIDADDLVQEALVRALSVHSLAEFDDPGAYLRTTMVRLASNHRRRLGRRHRALQRAAAATAVSVVEYPSDLDDLRRLSPPDRAVIFLSVVEGLAYDEIGAVLGCSAQAARTRASRALRRLRADMMEENRDVGP
jgi:DNA-directed RNA polymerase specialized sigma24 family protein